jgi:3-methyladenine DNA glycosylase AlkD
MTLDDCLAALRRAGTAQNRKIYARHGAQEPMFGVSYAEMGRLKKVIRVDDELAAGLWDTGNHDACILATMIADPAAATVQRLNAWAASSSSTVVADAVSGYVAQTRHAAGRVKPWTNSSREAVAVAGWMTLARLAIAPTEEDDCAFIPYLDRIVAKIHDSPNRVRESMNRTLIAIGCRNESLKSRALKAAAAVGHVEVDHGETSCETPDAAAYIEKTWAHKRPKGKAAGAKPARRKAAPRLC